MIKQHKIPTIIALLILLGGAVAGIFLVSQNKIFLSGANPDETPKEVRITNVTDKSFTVSWLTDAETEGFVAWGKSESLGQSTKDPSKRSVIHHISIDTLATQTNYFFKIGSNNKLFDNAGQTFQVKTAASPGVPPPPDVISGTVKDSSIGAAGVIVYVSFAGATPQSTLTDVNGRWSLPLSTVRASDLASYALYNKQTTVLDIFAQAGKNKFATAKILAGSAHPVPPIILGQTHDFTNIKPLPEGGVPTSTLDLSGLQATPAPSPSPTPTPPASSTKTVKITYPENSESVNTTLPEFRGTGTPGLTFTIKVLSPKTYSAQVTVDKNGSWHWSPPAALEAGSHTLTVSWTDEKGKSQTLSHTFTLLAAGTSSQPAFSASGSAQLATPTPTPKPTAASSATPKATPTPTSSPATGSARVSHPSTASGVPSAGDLTPTLGLIIMGIVLVLAGLFLPKTKLFS